MHGYNGTGTAVHGVKIQPEYFLFLFEIAYKWKEKIYPEIWILN